MLDAANRFNEAVRPIVESDKELSRFHHANHLSGITSVLDAYVGDVMRECIACFPMKSGEKQVKLEEVTAAASQPAFIKTLSDRVVNELLYKRFEELHSEFCKTLGIVWPKDNDLVESLAEIKASRDLFIHASGRVNGIYLQKAGTKARTPDSAGLLPIEPSYLEATEMAIREYVLSTYDLIPDRYRLSGRVAAFRAMWEMSELSRNRKFDDVWVVENSIDMVRPRLPATEYYWSTSEEAAFGFFLGIYSGDLPGRNRDLMYAIYRWPPETGVGQAICSWIESPFWF